MSEKIQKVLQNEGGNYILPFFWQHGEDEATLREYVNVIHNSNIGAFCVESRPHPDFVGPQWWHDMDIILDEAKKNGMKVWILDDSHFPTGFANGAVDHYDESFCRQSITHRVYEVKAGKKLQVSAEELKEIPVRKSDNPILGYLKEKNPRVFDDDQILDIYFVGKDGSTKSLKDAVVNGALDWKADADGRVIVLYLSRNLGFHTHYINMTHAASVKILIDTVYEAHWNHYKDEFGKTIAGFFSDEPELGNGFMYERSNYVGNPECDFPWSTEIAEGLKAALGADYTKMLYLIWEDNGTDEAAKIRYAYMDVLTRLVKKNFSYQIGDWCRTHGVKYIGHLIEDNDQHEMTGASLGHYFRGLAGQDWAGIDDIGGQVMPQQEDVTFDKGIFQARDGEFYHFLLGKLGSSAAAIEPAKHGNSMCEIFGAYRWQEGVRLEKYLADHFLVRGINHFVPHAFSPKAFPDSDCPPHFYAHGHNPQYRAFGYLMKYMNNVLELTNGGRHVAPVAVLYTAESSWADHNHVMEDHAVTRPLTENQIESDIVPQDVFENPEEFKTEIVNGALQVNTQSYKAVVVPQMKYVTEAFAKAVPRMAAAGVKVLFVNEAPSVLLDADLGNAADQKVAGSEAEREKNIIAAMQQAGEVVALDDLVGRLWEDKVNEIVITPDNKYVRYYHYEEADGSAIYMFVNEGTSTYEGVAEITDGRKGYWYDAWNNDVYAADFDGSRVTLSLEPLKSYILVLDKEVPALSESYDEKRRGATEIVWDDSWKRSLSSSVNYPDFGESKEVILPDHLDEEEPTWSGYARYENSFTSEDGQEYFLEITDAAEAVEVFVNGVSLGYQIVPTYKFDITDYVNPGRNDVRIEVATTLEREMSTVPDPMVALIGLDPTPHNPSGINGFVKLLTK